MDSYDDENEPEFSVADLGVGDFLVIDREILGKVLAHIGTVSCLYCIGDPDHPDDLNEKVMVAHFEHHLEEVVRSSWREDESGT